MRTVRFNVPGQPRGKGRPRFTRDGHAYTDSETRAYEAKIAGAYREQAEGYRFDSDTPLNMTIIARMKIPKRATCQERFEMANNLVKPKNKPDADNIAKTVQDALNGLAYADDSQISDLHVKKLWAEEPEIEVRITEAIS